MSRTYRKPSPVIVQGKESYIAEQLGYDYRFSGMVTKTVKRRKPKEQYEEEYKKAYDTAWREYNEKLKRASYDDRGRPFVGYRRDFWNRGYEGVCLIPNYIYEPRVFVSKHYYERVEQSHEERLEEYSKEYDTYTRDGRFSESGRKSAFKEASAKVTRIANKRLERRIVKDEEYDHRAYPNQHDGDYLMWSFW